MSFHFQQWFNNWILLKYVDYNIEDYCQLISVSESKQFTRSSEKEILTSGKKAELNSCANKFHNNSVILFKVNYSIQQSNQSSCMLASVAFVPWIRHRMLQNLTGQDYEVVQSIMTSLSFASIQHTYLANELRLTVNSNQ